MANINRALFYRNRKPEYNKSYVSTTEWNRDLMALANLLKSWGFVEVDVSDVAGWRIEEDNEYGPSILFEDNGYIPRAKCADVGFRYLKCKSKQSRYHLLETDDNGWVDLNGDYVAPGAYSIYISDLGFGRDATYAFLTNNKNTMSKIIDFMGKADDEQLIHKNIPPSGYSMQSLKDYTSPYINYKVANYLINYKNITGWANCYEPLDEEGKYWLKVSYDGASSENAASNFNLVDFAPIVIYSSWDNPVTWKTAKIKTTGNNVYVNNSLCFSEYDSDKDLLLVVKRNIDSDITTQKGDGTNKNGKLHLLSGGSYNTSMNPSASFDATVKSNSRYNLNGTTHYLSLSGGSTKLSSSQYAYVLTKNMLSSSELTVSSLSTTTSVFNSYISGLNVVDSYTINFTGKVGTLSGKSTPEVPGNILVYSLAGVQVSLNYPVEMTFKKTYTMDALHTSGYRVKKNAVCTFKANESDINATATYKANAPAISTLGTVDITYEVYRGAVYNVDIPTGTIEWIVADDRTNKLSFTNYNFNEKFRTSSYLRFTGIARENNNINWAIVCLKNYFVKNPPVQTNMYLYSNGTDLLCDISHNHSYAISFWYYANNALQNSASISSGTTRTLVAPMGWDTQSKIDNSYIEYTDPVLGDIQIPINDIPRKNNRTFNITGWCYFENKPYLLINNKTTLPTKIRVNHSGGNITYSVASSDTTLGISGFSESGFRSCNIEYYHPDQCKWISVNVSSLTKKTLVENGLETQYDEHYETSGIANYETRTYELQTRFVAQDYDMLSATVSTLDGFSAETTAAIVEKSIVGSKWCVKYRVKWSGGGPPYSRIKVTIKCQKYKAQ